MGQKGAPTKGRKAAVRIRKKRQEEKKEVPAQGQEVTVRIRKKRQGEKMKVLEKKRKTAE